MFRGPSPSTDAKAQSAPGSQGRPPRALVRLFAWWHRLFRVPRSRRNIALAIAAGTGLLVVVFFLALGPMVRSRVIAEANRRNLDVEIGSVRPGFFAVGVRDVHVRPRAASSERIDLFVDDVRIDLGISLSIRSITARGGRVVLEGEVDEIIARLRELRGKDDAPAAPSAGASKKSLHAENFALSWKIPSAGELTGLGLRASRDADVIALGCAKCTAHHGHDTLEANDASVELAGGAARRIKAASLHVEHAPPRRVAPAASPQGGAEPAPPPLPVSHKHVVLAKATVPPASDEPVLPLPDLHALRARIATAMATLAPRLPDGARMEIDGLSAKLDAEGEPIALGPAPLTVERRADRVHVTFSSANVQDQAAGGGTPLSIDADLPVGTGEISARLAGGPVSLAALGVKEGMRGLTDVSHGRISGKGQLVLSEAADALTFDGEVSVSSLSMNQPRIAPEPLRGIGFSVSARGVLDDHGKLRLDDGQLDMGALHLRTHGTVEEAPDHFGVALAVDVLPAACQALFDSAPQGLLPLVRAARVTGTFAAGINLAFDTRAIDKLSLDYKIGDECRMLEVPPDLSRERFEESFTYRTYKPDGTVGETTTGPGTPNWTALDDISPFMIQALLTTEDGAFYRHKGFNHAAIRSSVQANLKARRFVRGASTITMQLAKNLFLARDKALSRKIEEVILTDYLEQIFRKDDMMELYLNVVEFGPDVYGITQAASYYFGRKPEELHVGECFFLASLLPSPIRYGKLREAGVISENWMRHLKALMQIAEKNGKISHAELEDGLKEPITFVKTGEPAPEPRKPVTSSHRSGMDDDPWRPLD